MNINYSQKGTGPDIVLLHGWGGSINSLAKIQDILVENGFRVTNFDLPGFGSSDKPNNPANTDYYVEFLHKMLKLLKIVKPILIGHSFGGQISLNYVIKYPKIAAHLILINSAGIKQSNQAKRKIFLAPTKFFGKVFSLPILNIIEPIIKKLYYILIVGERDYLNAQGVMKETMKIVIREYADDRLSTIATPTLIIWGEKDKDTPLQQAHTLAKKIKGSRLEIVKDATHGLPLHLPEVVVQLIINYLHR
jgi:pimeloyl-ACP methyl ester carboxylesterase